MCIRLSDASRNWYFSVHKELFLHDGHQSSVDPGMFVWHEKGELLGMFIMYVDDFNWSGKATFEERMTHKIRSTFCCGKDSDDSFPYISLNIEHLDDGLILHQQRLYQRNPCIAYYIFTGDQRQGLAEYRRTNFVTRTSGPVQLAGKSITTRHLI